MKEMMELLSRLVAIDSVNPSLVRGASGEGKMAAFVSDWLRHAGVRVEAVPAETEGRPSVLGMVPGTGGGPTLLLYAHLDTVGVTGMNRPHRAAVQGDRMLGRGTLDMKGGLTAVLLAVAACIRRRVAGDVYVAAVADEEGNSLGMEAVLRRLAQMNIRPDAAIVPEPTQLQLCLGHRGFDWMTLTTHGRAAHTALRAEGIDAIARMGRVIVALERLDESLQIRPEHPLLGHGAVLASLVRGGSELFVYPAECRADVVRRTLPGESPAAVTDEVRNLLSELEQQDPNFSASLEFRLHRAPFETTADSPIAVALMAASERELGREISIVGVPFWTDAGLLAEAGISTAIFGPSGEGLHSHVEWVSLSSVEKLTKILIGAVRMFCR